MCVRERSDWLPAPLNGRCGRRPGRRILISLGTAVDEKQLVVIVAADLAESLGQLLLQAVDDAVGVEAEPARVVCLRIPYSEDGNGRC